MSFRQKAHEGRLALRKQLTDLLEKLADLNTEIAKLNYLREKKMNYPHTILDCSKKFASDPNGIKLSPKQSRNREIVEL